MEQLPHATAMMKLALIEAEKALNSGEIPVGCVFSRQSLSPTVMPVSDADVRGEVVVTGFNETNKTRNGTAHAELVAMNRLISMIGAENAQNLLSESELYVTCEPCIMCAAALKRMKIRKVYFGCRNDRFGGNGSILQVHKATCSSAGYAIECGLMESEAIELFQRFYESENRRAPESKRRKKK